MTASQQPTGHDKAVRAVMQASDCQWATDNNGNPYCEAHWYGWLRDVDACPKAERIAHVVLAALRAALAAGDADVAEALGLSLERTEWGSCRPSHTKGSSATASQRAPRRNVSPQTRAEPPSTGAASSPTGRRPTVADTARPLNASERRKIATLRRRRDYLNHLLRTGESTLSWDRVEATALTWAVNRIEATEAK